MRRAGQRRRPSARARRATLAVGAAAILALAGPALAVLPGEQLRDPRLEARARAISAQLRCLVCQNQSIDDSDAPLAGDLRVIIRERLSAGDTDRQAIDFVVARYGHFVLLNPPFESQTLLLWLGPALALAIGGVWVARQARGAAAVAEPPPALTAEERSELRRRLGGADAR
jgi:cytochrome c-type biogenesis protein CcmH